MEKAIVILAGLIFFIIFGTVLSKEATKEKIHVQPQNKAHHTKFKETARQHPKKLNEKCWPQRCNIICPIQVLPITPPGFLPSLPGLAYRPPVPHILNGINQYIDNGLSDLFGEDRSKDHPSFKLTKRQKRILLKQLAIGNQNGKKSYNFRQFSLNGCYVKCDEYQMYPGGYPAQSGAGTGQPIPPGTGQPIAPGNGQPVPGTTIQQGSTPGQEGEEGNEDEDDDDEDPPYHEGEDKPVEVTASPPDKRSQDIWDDDDSSELTFEDKHKGKGKSHHQKRKN